MIKVAVIYWGYLASIERITRALAIGIRVTIDGIFHVVRCTSRKMLQFYA